MGPVERWVRPHLLSKEETMSKPEDFIAETCPEVLLQDVCKALRADCEAFRKDAERYRHYRARAYKDGSTLALDVGVIDDIAIGDFGEFIDATADAAIADMPAVG